MNHLLSYLKNFSGKRKSLIDSLTDPSMSLANQLDWFGIQNNHAIKEQLSTITQHVKHFVVELSKASTALKSGDLEKAHHAYTKALQSLQELPPQQQANLYPSVTHVYKQLSPTLPPSLPDSNLPSPILSSIPDNLKQQLTREKEKAIQKTKRFVRHEEEIRELELLKTERIISDYKHKIHEASLRLAELEEHHDYLVNARKKSSSIEKRQRALEKTVEKLEEKKNYLEHEVTALESASIRMTREISQLNQQKERILKHIDQKEFELAHVHKVTQQRLSSRENVTLALSNLTSALRDGNTQLAHDHYATLRQLYTQLSLRQKDAIYPAIAKLQQEFVRVTQ